MMKAEESTIGGCPISCSGCSYSAVATDDLYKVRLKSLRLVDAPSAVVAVSYSAVATDD